MFFSKLIKRMGGKAVTSWWPSSQGLNILPSKKGFVPKLIFRLNRQYGLRQVLIRVHLSHFRQMIRAIKPNWTSRMSRRTLWNVSTGHMYVHSREGIICVGIVLTPQYLHKPNSHEKHCQRHNRPKGWVPSPKWGRGWSKLWPANFLEHLPIFAGNSRFTGISQLRAGKTRSKQPRSHCLSTVHLLPYM